MSDRPDPNALNLKPVLCINCGQHIRYAPSDLLPRRAEKCPSCGREDAALAHGYQAFDDRPEDEGSGAPCCGSSAGATGHDRGDDRVVQLFWCTECAQWEVDHWITDAEVADVRNIYCDNCGARSGPDEVVW